MFDNKLIPKENTQLKHALTNLYNSSGASADYKSVIDKKLEKIDQTIKEKIINTVTISKYFDELWKQTDLKIQDKDFVIRKLETIQENKKRGITSGDQIVSKSAGNLDTINSSFKMTPFEEFQLQEKVKEVKKKKQLEVETPLLSNLKDDLDVLHAINRPFRSVQNSRVRGIIHYTAGLCDVDDNEEIKKQKAEDFVKKIKEDKKEFVMKMKRHEKSVEERDNIILERLIQKNKEDEEFKQKERKKKLEEHIKELKARSEVRAKETAKWEEDYKSHLSKKPLYKEIEQKYKKGFVIPQLEERKRKLKELRDFHKPLDIKEILEHDRKVQKLLEEQQTKKNKKKEEENNWEYKKPGYESMHHKIFAEEMARARNQREEQEVEKMKRKEKVMELLQEVKEKHAPRVDPRKELERLEIIEKLKSKNEKTRIFDEEDGSEEARKAKKIGDDYLKAVKELVKSKGNFKTPNATGLPSDKREPLLDSKKGTTGSAQSEPTGKKRDYLSELRKENKIVDRSSRVDLLIKKKDLDEETRKELLLDEVNKMEEKAKRKEIVRKFKKPKNLEDVMEDEEYDKLYVNAIKAKLEMLSHL